MVPGIEKPLMCTLTFGFTEITFYMMRLKSHCIHDSKSFPWHLHLKKKFVYIELYYLSLENFDIWVRILHIEIVTLSVCIVYIHHTN